VSGDERLEIGDWLMVVGYWLLMIVPMWVVVRGPSSEVCRLPCVVILGADSWVHPTFVGRGLSWMPQAISSLSGRAAWDHDALVQALSPPHKVGESQPDSSG